MSNTLLVIMAHTEAQETYDRHLPLWGAHRCDMVVFTPEDATINTRGHFLWAYGPRGHHNQHANARFKRLINACCRTNFERFLICEYDAFCLSPEIPEFHYEGSMGSKYFEYHRPLLCGNVFHDDRPGRGFKGQTFLHPPLLFQTCAASRGIERVADALNQLPDDAEQNFWDRTLGLACENAGIRPCNFMEHGLGFAQNTILWDSEAHRAAAEGCVMFHGVKHATVLKAILAGHEEAKRAGKLPGLEIAI